MNDALTLIDLKRSFVQGEAEIRVLNGVNATLRRGEIVALLGPSGSGKSTLLQAVGLLEGGFEGQIIIDGLDVAAFGQADRTQVRREKIGFVYQFHHLLSDFDALDNVILPQLIYGTSQADAAAHAAELLTRLGLGERLRHKPSKLSGGEQQRVAVARALANRPLLVLADEPTGNLDVATSDRVFAELLEQVRGQGLAALIATHNPDLARRMDRVVTLRDGKILAA
jgi:lipoprotein-releasing system ATP-binding protein